MITLLFVFVSLVAFALAVVLGVRRRRTPRPTQGPMIVILLALGFAFLFLAPAVQVAESHLVPSLGRLLSNACTLVAAFGFLTLMLHASPRADQVEVRTRWRLVVLLVALAVMVVAFLASKVPTGLGLFTGQYRAQPTLAVYVLVYSAYLGVAVVDLGWLALRAVRHSRRYLRIGMVLVLLGCLLAVGYVTHKVVAVLTEVFGGPAAEGLCAGPFATTSCTFEVGFPPLSVLAIILGSTIPALGPRIAAALRWPGRWRAYRRLHPLWQALYEAAPEIALTSPSAVQGSVPRRDIAFRLYRRVIEIRDGLLVLEPYRNRAGVGSSGDRPAAEAEAAAIAEALRRKESGEPAAEVSTPDGEVDDSAADLAGETAWLTRVSDAFARRPRS